MERGCYFHQPGPCPQFVEGVGRGTWPEPPEEEPEPEDEPVPDATGFPT